MSTATVKPTTVRIEEGLKEQATEFLDSVGLSLNSYLNLAVRQLVNQRKIPFDIVGRPEVPNEATRRAMVIAEAHELGTARHSITLMSLYRSSMRTSDV
mgnify:CR=1 FL=1